MMQSQASYNSLGLMYPCPFLGSVWGTPIMPMPHHARTTTLKGDPSSTTTSGICITRSICCSWV